MSMWQDICKFHSKYGLEYGRPPRKLTKEEYDFRLDFLIEELTEFKSAENLEDQIDALVDLVFVAMGTAYRQGFNWPEHWNEVVRANLAKVRVDHPENSKRGSSFDIIKPPDWEGPDHTKILDTRPYKPHKV